MSQVKSRKGCTRACERCHKFKVRCSGETIQEHGQCKRCLDAGVECHFPQVTEPKQRRRRIDTRVALLEKRLKDVNDELARQNDLRPEDSDVEEASLHLIRSSPSIDHGAEARVPASSDADITRVARQRSTPIRRPERAPGSYARNGNEYTVPGFIDSSELSYAEATSLFAEFITRGLVHFPVLALDDNEDFASLRQKKPLLLFAIVTAACRGRHSSLFEQFHSRLQRVTAEKAVLEGEKTIELIQVILLMEVWFYSPKNLTRLNFYQWIHIAGTMAIHLGLVGGPGRSLSREELQGSQTPTQHQMEAWRAGLAICISASTAAISLHRHAILNVRDHSRNHLHLLKRHAKTVSDRKLVAWAKLQIMAEEVESIKTQTHRESERAAFQNDLRRLENLFDEWREAQPPEVMDGSITIHYLYLRWKTYELAMIKCQHMAAVKSPSSGPSSTSGASQYHTRNEVTPALVKALTSIIHYCHLLLDEFCRVKILQYLYFPTVTAVRAIHVVNTLSALNEICKKPQHVISTIIDEDMVKFDTYLKRTKNYFMEVMKIDPEHNMLATTLDILNQISNQSYVMARPATHDQPDTRKDRNIDQRTPQNDLEVTVLPATSPHSYDDDSPDHREATGLHTADTTTTATVTSHTVVPDIPMDDTSAFDLNFGSDYALMFMPEFATGTNWWDVDNTEFEPFVGNAGPNTMNAGFPNPGWYQQF